MKRIFSPVIALFIVILFSGVKDGGSDKQMVKERNIPRIDLYELKRGDLLIRPNHNWWPGTSIVPDGSNFGHTAIVVEGVKDTNILNLLGRAVIFESQARRVPEKYQLRKVNAYAKGTDFRFANTNFSKFHEGNRYLIRPGLSQESIDSLISYVLDQDDGISSWRALKDYDRSKSEGTSYWYCSQLIWQAYYEILGVDIDPNKGLIVYPNDLIESPYFRESGSYIARF